VFNDDFTLLNAEKNDKELAIWTYDYFKEAEAAASKRDVGN
jgi:hypothetical protein